MRWRPTAALIRVTTLVVGALGLSLALGRPDLAALGAPLALGAVLALTARRPDRTATPAAVAQVSGPLVGGQPVEVSALVAGLTGAQLVSVSLPDPQGGPAGAWATAAGDAGTLVGRTLLPDWGALVLARPDITAASPDGLWEIGPMAGRDLWVTVPPAVRKIDPIELPPIFGGWAGDHVSRRPGQGGDLIDLREFAPGDRLRSIHWRAYARHQKLYVRRTRSDADAEFVLCVDTRDEVRPQRPVPRTAGRRLAAAARYRWARSRRFLRRLFVVEEPAPDRPPRPPSSLDLSVRAAAAIAAAQLTAGDRVGVLDLSTYRRHVRLGTGHRHLERIRHQLATMDHSRSPWLVRAELWGLPPGAVVVIISPLTDDAVLSAAVDCRARGHQVIVVDALPAAGLAEVAGDRHDERHELALLLAERDLRLDRLRARGIPIAGWERGSFSAELTALRRLHRDRR